MPEEYKKMKSLITSIKITELQNKKSQECTETYIYENKGDQRR